MKGIAMDITLRGLNLGSFGLPISALLDAPEYENVWHQCPALAYIVEHPEGRVLFETGLSELALDEWLPEWLAGVDLTTVLPEHKLAARLKQIGLGPEDFRYVVLGHLHTDHSGGARIFKDAGVEVVVHDAEYKNVRDMPEQAANFFNKVDVEVLEHVSLTTIDEAEYELLPGVRLVHLPGHTPGLMGMMIDLPHSGTVLLTSDAMYRHETYLTEVGSQTVWDTDEWSRSLARIKKIAMEREALIFPGHDGEAIRQLATRTEVKRFEFTPDFTYS
jgi:glyoxylase-like metal-dependent hydrolase (beta-lactamase superfamily II)